MNSKCNNRNSGVRLLTLSAGYTILDKKVTEIVKIPKMFSVNKKRVHENNARFVV
jgi:hypothetical protein